ncbi:MAG: hypothetical protein IPL61_38200 [Myxococcales bacterium]|nr:hypothetical protein [Myxococcales bacterium]
MRAVAPTRRRTSRRGLIVVAGVAALHAAVLLGLALAPSASVTWIVTIEASPPPAAPPSAMAPVPRSPPTPAPVSAPLTSARACPLARTDAPRLRPPVLPEDIDHVAVAPSNVGWVAAWNPRSIYVSTDAGAHFARVLDGPGRVVDVGFDCFGTVVAIRGTQLGLRSGAREAWRSVPGLRIEPEAGDPDLADDAWRYHAAVVSGGPEVVVVGLQADPEAYWSPRIARSHDLGATWGYHDVDGDWEHAVVYGRQREDGTIAIELPFEDCRAAGISAITIRAGRVATADYGTWPSVGEGVWPATPGLPADAVWLGDGLARAGADVYRVAGDRARKLPVIVEGDQALRDGAGRVWTVVCGQPWIARATASGRTCDADAD